jgi:hypothetical protein
MAGVSNLRPREIFLQHKFESIFRAGSWGGQSVDRGPHATKKYILQPKLGSKFINFHIFLTLFLRFLFKNGPKSQYLWGEIPNAIWVGHP